MKKRARAAAYRFLAVLATLVAVVIGSAHATGIGVTLAYANAYSFVTVCDLTQPLAFIDITATNPNTLPSAPVTISASEAIGKLGGSFALPALAPHASLAVSVPLGRLGATDPATLAGLHHIIISNGTTTLAVDLPFPATLCKSASTPAPGATPRPGINTTGSTSNKGPVRPIVLTLSPPANLRSVSAGTDCGTHVGPIGALVCPDMMKSGNMLLIWDWAPGATGLDAITGYRVYRVGRGIGYQRNPDTLIGTVSNQGQTLFDVPKPAGGVAYDGMCFTVTAFAGARESVHSPQYCAVSTSAAKTATFTPVREVSITRSADQSRREFPPDNVLAKNGWRVVGYRYSTVKSIAGDLSGQDISRYAMLFDVSKLVGRRLVEAHLTLNVLKTNNSAPDCTNSVGSGVETWWTDNRWPEGTFTPSLTLLNGQLRVEATNLVSLWIVGRPNQGIILRNDDENLRAFTNKSCVTFYSSPVLTITYY